MKTLRGQKDLFFLTNIPVPWISFSTSTQPLTTFLSSPHIIPNTYLIFLKHRISEEFYRYL